MKSIYLEENKSKISILEKKNKSLRVDLCNP